MIYNVQALSEPFWLAIPWYTLHIEVESGAKDMLDVYYRDITITLAIAGCVGCRMRSMV